ncbi:MAG: tetratricopeptide repeat protein, partial [bacterium]
MDYAVLGNFKTHPSQYDLNFKLYNVEDEIEILNERSRVNPNELFEFCAKLSRKILVNTVGREGQVHFNNEWKSISQVKDYFNSKLYLFTNQTELALQFARQALKKDSSSAVCLNFLAELFIKRGIEKKANGESPLEDFRLAKSTLHKILSFQKNNSTTLHLLGELSLVNEKWHQAEEYLRESLQLNPLDPDIYFDVTQLHASRYADLGFKNEKELLKRAIYINPCFFDAQLTLAND